MLPRCAMILQADSHDVSLVKSILVRELSLQVGVGEASVCGIFRQLLLKVFARLVPRMLTDTHNETRKTVSSERLEQ